MDEFLNTAFGEVSSNPDEALVNIDGIKARCADCPWQLFAKELARRTSDEDARHILVQLALERTQLRLALISGREGLPREGLRLRGKDICHAQPGKHLLLRQSVVHGPLQCGRPHRDAQSRHRAG